MNISRSCPELSAWNQSRIVQLVGSKQYLDCGDYWLSTSPINSTTGKAELKHRLNIEKCGRATGYDRFKSRDSLLQVIVSLENEYISPDTQANLDRLEKYRPRAIKFYEQSMDCKVSARGSIIPKWNPWLISQIDGDVIGTEGIIKVECPQTMYASILRYNCVRQTNPNACLRDAIWKPNYFEIQAKLALMGKKWCDYIIYVPKDKERNREGSVGIYRVEFDADYWNRFIYPLVQEFIRDLRIRVPSNVEQTLIPTDARSFSDLSHQNMLSGKND